MNNSLKRLALIPARGGSKRIPRKNIIDFCGKPMLAYPLIAAQESELFDLIHVSTEDEEIRTVAQKFGANVSLPRPVSLADDVTPILPLARWVVQNFKTRKEKYFDDIFILFPCSPLIEVRDLLSAYERYLDHDRKRNLLTVCRAPVYPKWYFHRGDNGRLIPLTPGGSFVRSQELQPAYYETGTFSIFSREWLLGTDNLEDDTNYIDYELPAWRSVDIDEPGDLEYAKVLYQYAQTRR
jgi:pseudaminic acid cytidylyltransferase